jgi:D-glycero-alpha-D-manno-heptose 1-phosphate guanylyltransferase
MLFSKNLSSDTAILLVGGRGTRLGALTEQTPKPLLSVAGRPFLFHVLDYLIQQKIKRVILATGYLASEFEQALGSEYCGVSLAYSYEATLLGTGGAIALALAQTAAPEVFVLNGDTYFPADLTALDNVHTIQRASLSMILRRIPEVSRYGHITVERDLVTALHEKGATGSGLINGGIYLLNRAAFLADAPVGAFSLERDLLPDWIARQAVACTLADNYFIDIGVPADLERAQHDLA